MPIHGKLNLSLLIVVLISVCSGTAAVTIKVHIVLDEMVKYVPVVGLNWNMNLLKIADILLAVENYIRLMILRR